MTPAEISRSLEQKKLVLSGWAWFTHFEPVFGLAFIASLMPFFAAYDLLTVGEVTLPDSVTRVFLFATVTPATAAFFLLIHRNRELRLTKVNTEKNWREITLAILRLAENNNWQVRNNTKKCIILRTHPRFWSGSWGERITILLEKDNIWVNSICDPEKRASLVSMGRNRQNIELCKKVIGHLG